MAGKEPKNIKRFPKRLLSSFRKGKKVNVPSCKIELPQKSDESVGFTSYDLENAQNENATIDFEASIILNSPRKNSNNERGLVDALVTPKRNLRRVKDEDSTDTGDNFSPPQLERLVLGGRMSASTDSGIDCSILLSEKNSPEQFVAFTRREAERLRQEQFHNASVLETLNEADRSSSEDCDTGIVYNLTVLNVESEDKSSDDQLIGAVGGSNETSFQTNDILDNDIEILAPPVACNGMFGSYLSDGVIAENAEQTLPDSVSNNSGGIIGDYVILRENVDNAVSPLVDVASFISHGRRHDLSGTELPNEDIFNQSIATRNVSENETTFNVPTTNNQTMATNEIINIDNCYMHYYANRTDEIKSAEARRRQQSPETLQLDVSHDIVNPVPIVTSSIATHRVLQSTPSPARLYVNENSAFAKCKSLKRSVSDVGKGILGRFRHRSKDGRAPKDENVTNDDKAHDNTNKKSGLTKFKKLDGRKEKDRSRLRHSSEQSGKSKVDTATVHFSQPRNQSNKSPVTKEIVSVTEKVMEKSSDNINKLKTSPVYKEILSDDVKQEFKAVLHRQSPPIVMESIQDLTSSISQMTSALCASSAESIACICDCKNRFSDPECCEKRKTPSPLGCLANYYETTPTHADSELTKDLHNESKCDFNGTSNTDLENKACEYNDTYTMSTDEITESSPLIEASHTDRNEMNDLIGANKLFYDGNDESSDESGDEINTNYFSDDNDNFSTDECSDLDCSNCCNASPNTGNKDCLSSSSDSESSITDSCENLLISKNCTDKQWVNAGNPGSCQSSRSSSATSGSSAQNSGSSSNSCSSSGSSSPVLEDSSFENSSFSVSFKEIDFENGDVMYVESNLDDNFGDDWVDVSEDNIKLSSVCATPASSPRLCGDVSVESSPNVINPCINNDSNSSQNKISIMFNKGCSKESVHSPLSSSGSNQSSCSASPIAGMSPTPLNLSQDSTFTNVSFEGSFADASFSVHGQSASPRHDLCDEQLFNNSIHSLHSDYSLMNRSERLNDSDLNDSRYKYKSDRKQFTASLSMLDDSRLLQNTLRKNHYNSVNDSNGRNDSRLNEDNRRRRMARGFKRKNEHDFYRHSLDTSRLSTSNMNDRMNRFDTSAASFQGLSPASSPLDLSINKGRSTSLDRSINSEQDKQWVNRHVGQVYSPAKRVLHKNSGMSESDLCKQILDLYVSDADESGFDLVDGDDSSIHSTSMDSSNMSANLEEFPSTNLDDSGSEEERPGLHYGTYVAPRNVVKETNVDDFKTTTVWTCYTGEARTRKLQGQTSGGIMKGEDRRQAALSELHNMSVEERSSKKKRSVNNSQGQKVKGHEREALRDQTNTAPRLSSLNMPPSLAKEIQGDSLEHEIRETTQRKTNMNEKRFDHLTMLHTAHNGQRKVRCLTMDESQNVVKYYPPPKEASRISWGQTISEMDLYRHTPRKTPVKTRPILNQKENTYPYEGDTPSPIVLTKMRKPKSLAKKYKNWPWS